MRRILLVLACVLPPLPVLASEDFAQEGAAEAYCQAAMASAPPAVVEWWRAGCSVREEDRSAEGGEEGVLERAAGQVAGALGVARREACEGSVPVSVRTALEGWREARGRALLGVHRLEVHHPSLEVHEDLGVVRVAVAREIPLPGGESELHLVGDTVLGFEVAPADLETLQHLSWMEDLALRLVFEAVPSVSSAEGGGGWCAPRLERGGWTVHGALLGGVLVDRTTGEELARAETGRYAMVRLMSGVRPEERLEHGVPSAMVTALEVEGDTSCSRREEELVRIALEVLGNRCYIEALHDSGRVQGALVVRFDVSSRGAVGSARVLIDVAQHGGLGACLLSGLGGISVARGRDAESFRVRASLIFRRDGPSTDEPAGPGDALAPEGSGR